jgi:hypothetical protein
VPFLDGIGRKTGNQMWLENPSTKMEGWMGKKSINEGYASKPCLITRGHMSRCIRISIWY